MSALEQFLAATELDPAKQPTNFLYAAKEAFDVDLRATRQRHHSLGFSDGLSRDIQWICWCNFLENEQVQTASKALSSRRDRWQRHKLGERI